MNSRTEKNNESRNTHTVMSGLRIGVVVGKRFKVLKEIVHGTQARIYKAEDIKTGEFRAIKYVDHSFPKFQANLAQLKREAAILDKLNHIGGIVKYHKFASNEKMGLMLLEWIDGLDGDVFIKKSSQVKWRQWLWTAKRLTSMIYECHRLGVMHRDVKPHNIIIDESLSPRLIDFGISRDSGYVKIEQDELMQGTLSYTCPELWQDGKLTTAGEIYSLGVTLYEFLLGKLPFQSIDPGELQQMKDQGSFAMPTSLNPDLPVEADVFFSRILDPDPNRRFQGAAEVLSFLSGRVSTAKTEIANSFYNRTCINCEGDLWSSLSFCTCCGSDYSIRPQEGKAAVIVWSTENKEELYHKGFDVTGGESSKLKKQRFMGSYPRFLMTGLSNQSAQEVASAFKDDSTSISIIDRITLSAVSKFKLEMYQVILVFISATLFFLALTKQMPIEIYIISIFLGLVLIYMLCNDRLQSLVPVNTLRAKNGPKPWKQQYDIKSRLSKLTNQLARENASRLVRVTYKAYQGLKHLDVTDLQKQRMDNDLANILLVGLDCQISIETLELALMDQFKRGNPAKKQKAIAVQLESLQDASAIKKAMDRIGELDIRAKSIDELERRKEKYEMSFSGILSMLNGLQLEISNRRMDVSADILGDLVNEYTH